VEAIPLHPAVTKNKLAYKHKINNEKWNTNTYINKTAVMN